MNFMFYNKSYELTLKLWNQMHYPKYEVILFLSFSIQEELLYRWEIARESYFAKGFNPTDHSNRRAATWTNFFLKTMFYDVVLFKNIEGWHKLGVIVSPYSNVFHLIIFSLPTNSNWVKGLCFFNGFVSLKMDIETLALRNRESLPYMDCIPFRKVSCYNSQKPIHKEEKPAIKMWA